MSKLNKAFIVIFSFLLIINASIHTVSAQTITKKGVQTTPTSLQFISLTPAIIEQQLLKSIVNNYEVKVKNIANFPLGIRVSAEGFDPSDQLSEVSFVKNTLSSWTKIENPTFILEPGDEKTISVTISPPKNALDKGYYEVIFFTPFMTRPLDAHSPKIVSKIGSLFLLTIGEQNKNDLEKKVSITNFSFKKLIEKQPVTGTLDVKNDYFTHFKAKPFVEIAPLFGKATTFELEEKRVLPGKIRRWSMSFSNLPKSFFYTATLKLSLGEGKYLVEHNFFFVAPFKLLFVLGLTLIIILLLIFRRKQITRALRILFKGK